MTLLSSSNSQVYNAVELAGLDAEIRPQSVALSLMQRRPAPKAIGDFSVTPKIATVTTPSWASEGGVKAVGTMTFARKTIGMRKVAMLLPWTEEFTMDSLLTPGAIRDAVTRAAAQEVDRALWRGAGDSDGPNEPRGLFNAGNYQSVSWSLALDIGENLAEMLRVVREDNFEPSAFVMVSNVLHALQLVEDGQQGIKYPEARLPQPRFMGIPIVVSNNCSTQERITDGYQSDVFLADWREVFVWTALSEVRISDVASFDDGQTTVHTFQEDKVVLRYVQRVSDVYVRDANAVAIMSNVLAPTTI